MIRALIDLYCFILIIDWILAYLPQFRHHPVVQRISQIANYSLNPVRRLMPRELPIDISPLIVILALKLFQVLW